MPNLMSFLSFYSRVHLPGPGSSLMNTLRNLKQETYPPSCCILKSTILSIVLQTLRERLLPWHHVAKSLTSSL